MFGNNRPAGETPFRWRNKAFRWRANDGPLLVLFESSLSSSDQKKNVVRDGPPLVKLTGSAHALDLVAH